MSIPVYKLTLIYFRILIFVSTAMKPYMEKIDKAVGELQNLMPYLEKMEKTADVLTKAAANMVLAQNLEAKKPPKEPLLVLPLNPERMIAMEKASPSSKLREEFVSSLINNQKKSCKIIKKKIYIFSDRRTTAGQRTQVHKHFHRRNPKVLQLDW